MDKYGILVLAAIVFLAVPATALVPADYARPQIVEKPLFVTPGQPVGVTIYNGGHYAWTDLAVSVAGASPVSMQGVLEPEGFVTVDVPAPLIYLLQAESMDVSLSYAGTIMETKELPVEFLWPKQSVIVDPNAPAGPEFVILIDATQFPAPLGGVQVEVTVLEDGKTAFLDFYGPFYLDADERFVYRAPIPDHYLRKGDFQVRGTFYEREGFLAETVTSFSYGKDSGSSWASLVLLLGVVALLIISYLVMDAVYYRRSLQDSWYLLRR